jgi:hypothetical protein
MLLYSRSSGSERAGRTAQYAISAEEAVTQAALIARKGIPEGQWCVSVRQQAHTTTKYGMN